MNLNKLHSMNFNNQDKFYHPNDLIELTVNNLTLHNLPSEIKDEDENSVFNYSVILLNKEFNNGKFIPKKLTEEEILKLQEEKNNKNKKKKNNIEPEIKEEEIDINTLEEEEFYKYFEDIYKNSKIFFDFSENIEDDYSNKILLTGKKLAIFEEIIYKEKKDCGLWLIIKREKFISNEELQKLQKKNKNILNEIKPNYYKTFLNFDVLKNNTNHSYRNNLEEFVFFEKNEDETDEDFEKRINQHVKKEYDRFYINISISLNFQLIPEIKEGQLKISDVLILNKSFKIQKKSNEKIIEKEYKNLINSLYEKYKYILDDSLKKLNIDINKSNFNYKKEKNKEMIIKMFYENLSSNPEFSDIKQKLIQIASKISKNIFNKSNNIEGNIKENNKFFTELHSYLISKMIEFLNQIIKCDNNFKNNEIIKENKVLKKENELTVEKLVNKDIQFYKYDLIKIYRKEKRYEEAIIIIKEILNKDKENHKIYFLLANLFILMGKYEDAELNMNKAIFCNREQKIYFKIIFFIFIKRNKTKEAFVIMKYLLDKKPHSIKNNLFNFLIYKINNFNNNLGDKYFEFFKRNLMRKLKQLPSIKTQLESIINEKYAEISEKDLDNYYIKIINFLIKWNFKSLINEILKIFNDKNNKDYLYYNYLINKKKYFEKLSLEELLEKVDYFIENDIYKNYFVYQKFIIKIKFNDINGIEEYFNDSIKYNNNNDNKKMTIKTLFKMAMFYKNNKDYELSRIILYKLIEYEENNFIYWKELGIVCCLLKQYDDCEEAFQKANILDYKNSEIWMNIIIYLLKINDRERLLSSIKELSKLKIYNFSLLIEIIKLWKENELINEYNYYKEYLVRNYKNYENYILNKNLNFKNIFRDL